MSDDPNELVYVEHNDGDDGTIDEGAWVPRSSLRQHAQANWFPADPPATQMRTGPQVAAASVQMVEQGNDPNRIVVISNSETGGSAKVTLMAYLAQWQHAGWVMEGDPVPPSEPQPIVRSAEFDPSNANARAVLDRLKISDDAERARIIAVEKENQNRKSIVEWEPPADSENETKGEG